jgi:hypothetical protein
MDGYRRALQKHLAIRNGKLLREFNKLYDPLAIAGYYRVLLHDDEHREGCTESRAHIYRNSELAGLFPYSYYFGQAVSFPFEPGTRHVEIPDQGLSISSCVDL